jgi:uncharacterized phage-associated protein
METKTSTYDSVVAAKYLMALAFSKGKVLNVTKVQKLLYMAYGFFLSEHNIVLLSESPKAWPYGPVFPRTRKKVNYSDIIKIDNPDLLEIKEDNNVTNFFNILIDKYSKYTASQLSEWSHAKDGPWDLTIKQKDFKWSSPIPDELIKNYFSDINF